MENTDKETSEYRFDSAMADGRPIRLCELTRRFAAESLHGKYGDEAMQTMFVSLDDLADFDAMDDYERYNAGLLRIVQEAPIRITKEERICGAATLGAAIMAKFPAARGGEALFWGINHLTLNFSRPLREGMDAYVTQLVERLEDTSLSTRAKAQLHSILHVLNCLHLWHDRYMKAVEHRPDLAAVLKRVPFAPAQNFHEAVQSLWFLFSFTRLCGNWSGIGRLDLLLGDYLEKDLATGVLTLEEAREILASFFIKGCEWIRSNPGTGSGDAQHYQNIVLGGTDADGNDLSNAVTYLVLDIVEELPIGDFPITVRVSSKTPEKLLRRIAQVVRHGGGVVAIYDEDTVLKAMERFGFPKREAIRFANDGCWEVQVPGATMFTYCPFDVLRILLQDTLHLNQESHAHFDDFESLYGAFRKNLSAFVDAICTGVLDGSVRDWRNGGTMFYDKFPTPVIDLLEDGCIASARGYLEGGPRYTVISPHIGGAPDVGNSLYAIDRLCFREKRVEFDRLMRALQTDWQDEEVLRQYVRNRYVYYGNDNDESDAYVVRLLNDFASDCDRWSREDLHYPIRFPAGVSTFGRQIEWLPNRMAVPFGYRKGDILAGNDSPTPGTDFSGATAVIRSYAKADLVRQTTGAALDLRLFPGTVAGENGITALVGLFRGFCQLGGFFLQIDVEDAETLRRAQEHPEDYKTLSVRVSGWNARFVTLDSEWQRMIIERTAQKL